MDHPTHPSLKELFRKSPDTIKPGLKRMQRALDALGIDPKKLPSCVLVGGTNGKGSTSGMLWRLLVSAGLRCGLFTSPHLVHYHERFQHSSRMIDDHVLIEDLRLLQAELGQQLYDELSFFEVATLQAIRLFSAEESDVNIFEVGLGGRWDATNCLNPMASVIVSIDYDHQQWLGSTLELIAREKLGILRSWRPVFLGLNFLSPSKDQVLAQVMEVARTNHNAVFQVGREIRRDKDKGIWLNAPQSEEVLNLPFPEWVKALPEVLQENFLLSVLVYFYLMDEFQIGGSECFTVKNLVTQWDDIDRVDLPWPYSLMGRGQSLVVHDNDGKIICDLFLDVCHNVASAQQLVSDLQRRFHGVEGRSKYPAMVSFSRDKDVAAILEVFAGSFDPIVLFKNHSERSIKPGDLSGSHEGIPFFSNFEQAWNDARIRFGKVDGPWVVCGSFFAVGEVIEYFQAWPQHGNPLQTLRGACPLLG
jgi:dihydrofolate synthase/folylpolyglutamate synthase